MSTMEPDEGAQPDDQKADAPRWEDVDTAGREDAPRWEDVDTAGQTGSDELDADDPESSTDS
jgi:hypothetical protein